MERKQKLIFIDLDGTLLDSSRFISDRSKKTLNRLKQQGDLVCIASGRPYDMVRLYIHELQITTPVITNTAANICSPSSGEILRQTFLPIEETERFLSFCEYHNLDWAVFRNDSIFTGNTSVRLKRYEEYNTRLQAAGFPALCVSVLGSAEKAKHLLPAGAERLSMLVHSNRELYLISSYFRNHSGLNCIRSTPESFDIVHPTVDKWSGVRFIADYYGIPLSMVYTFGNDRNDLTMIRNCRNSFVVENGEPEVLSCAAHIIQSNDNDGVAKAIEKYLLD